MRCWRSRDYLPMMKKEGLTINSGIVLCFRFWIETIVSLPLAVVLWEMQNPNIWIRRKHLYLIKAGISMALILFMESRVRVSSYVKDIWMSLHYIRQDLPMQLPRWERLLPVSIVVCLNAIRILSIFVMIVMERVWKLPWGRYRCWRRPTYGWKSSTCVHTRIRMSLWKDFLRRNLGSESRRQRQAFFMRSKTFVRNMIWMIRSQKQGLWMK